MNTALKSNVYPIKPLDNGITKSRSKKEILLDKLSKAIQLKHYSKATDRIYMVRRSALCKSFSATKMSKLR